MLIKASTAIGVSAALLSGAQPSSSLSNDDLLGWTVRAMLAAFIALGGYLLRDAAKTLKETHSSMLVMKTKLDGHDVMFEHWLDELIANGQHEQISNLGRRSSDELLRKLIAERMPERQISQSEGHGK